MASPVIVVHGGIILLDCRGRLGVARSTPRMAWALRTPSRDDFGID